MADRKTRTDDLQQMVELASARHQREYERYAKMLTSGFTGGRFYTKQQLEKQLAQADQALADAQQAMAALEKAMDEEEGQANN